MTEARRHAEHPEQTEQRKMWETPALTVLPVDRAEGNPTVGDDGLGAGS